MASSSVKLSLSSLQRSFRWLIYWFMIFLGIAGVGLMLLWAAGTFHAKVPDSVATPRKPIPAAAQLIPVQLVSIPRFETAVGTVQAVRDASVASKILARVEEVNVTAGQRVTQGEPLVKLQSDDLAARLGQAESNRNAAEARAAQARAEFDRAKSLLVQRAISQSEYQQREADLQTATADLKRASQAIDEAKIQMSFATIVAPFDGVVIDKQIKAGDTALPGQVLFRIYDPTHMQLVAQVRESLALSLKPGQQITAGMASMGYECQATISEIVPQANSLTHSFDVKVIGPCPPGVYSGMFGRLKMPVGQEQVLLIPAESVVRVGQLTMVYIAKNDQMELRSIQVGRRVDDQVQVLAGITQSTDVFGGAR
jgi:RND family efflux transporter MFP subunit